MQMMGMMTPIMNILSAGAGIAGGRAASDMANTRAAQMDRQAGQARASSQRAAIEERRKATLVNSSLQARAGGSGGDVSVVNTAADIAGEGEYRALASMFEGESQAVGLENQGRMERAQGKQAKMAGYISAIPNILSAGNSLFEKYGDGGLDSLESQMTKAKATRAGYTSRNPSRLFP